MVLLSLTCLSLPWLSSIWLGSTLPGWVGTAQLGSLGLAELCQAWRGLAKLCLALLGSAHLTSIASIKALNREVEPYGFVLVKTPREYYHALGRGLLPIASALFR